MGSSSPFSSTTFDFDGEWIDWPARNRKDVHYHDSAHRHIPKQIFVTSVWGWKTSTPEVIQWRLIGFFKGHGLRRWQYDSITKFIYISRWFFVSPDAWSLSCWVVVLKIVYVHPLFGEIIPIWLTHIFQMKPPTRLFQVHFCFPYLLVDWFFVCFCITLSLSCMFLTVFFVKHWVPRPPLQEVAWLRQMLRVGTCSRAPEWLTCESLGRERFPGDIFSDY